MIITSDRINRKHVHVNREDIVYPLMTKIIQSVIRMGTTNYGVIIDRYTVRWWTCQFDTGTCTHLHGKVCLLCDVFKCHFDITIIWKWWYSSKLKLYFGFPFVLVICHIFGLSSEMILSIRGKTLCIYSYIKLRSTNANIYMYLLHWSDLA